MILGMPGCFALELAEMANIVERNRWMAHHFIVGVHRLCLGKMEHRPEQHRGMAVREHESIAVGPDRVLGIEAHDPVPDRVDQRRESHRRAWMSGLGLLDRIYRERANSIDSQLNSFIV